MVLLSDLRRNRLVDASARQARLLDLAVDLAGSPYPPVTRIIYAGPRDQPLSLPWQAVADSNWRWGRLHVPDLAAGRAAPADALGDTVLLKRDLLDALVLDTAGRRALRANDLWLREEYGQLWLRGVDVSPWAVLRRLGRGWLGRGAERRVVDWASIVFLRGNPRHPRGQPTNLRRLQRLPPAAIARLADALPYPHGAELLTLLDEAVAADTLEAMAPERQVQVIEELDEERGSRLLALMAPDLAADLLGLLEPSLAQRSLNRLPARQADAVVDLLRYPPDTAGGIMTNQVLAVPATLTVSEARAALRDDLLAPDFIYYVYVVDDLATRQLQGVLTLRDLLVREDQQPIADIMRRDLVTVDALEPAHVVAERVVAEDLSALPVVARSQRLLGVVTLDAAILQAAPNLVRQQGVRVFS